MAALAATGIKASSSQAALQQTHNGMAAPHATEQVALD
jgi:hypothetical protein